jgi:hypothetical protein
MIHSFGLDSFGSDSFGLDSFGFNSCGYNRSIVYAARMSRKFFLAIAILLSLAPAFTAAAPPHGKPHIYKWHGYGFLPGYHQPPNNNVPIYSRKPLNDGTPPYTPYYWWGGSRYYFGDPGFYHGRYNGGSFGPCWTYTPIGYMWNCG